MTGAHRLPIRFDPAPLHAEVADIERQIEWADHWASAEGHAWSIIPLRSEESTTVLDRAPHLRDVLGSLRTRILSARLSKLRAGTSIRRHRDFAYYGERRMSFERGFIRLHAPIVTDHSVTWWLQDRAIDMRPGEIWYLNVCLPHAVENRSPVDRIHLVVEVEVNDWVRSLFPPETVRDRLRGMALRRFEPVLWSLVRPLWAAKRRLERRAA